MSRIFLVLLALLIPQFGWSIQLKNPFVWSPEVLEITLGEHEEIVRRHYIIPPSARTEEFMLSFSSHLKKMKVSSVEKRWVTLISADVSHWLGHFYEERGQLWLAWEAHAESYELYRSSGLVFSPHINWLNGSGHAAYHLRTLADRVKAAEQLPLEIATTPILREPQGRLYLELYAVQLIESLRDYWSHTLPGACWRL